MKEYKLEATDKTPEIHLKSGLVSIRGRSIPEDPHKVFRSAKQWIAEYVKQPAKWTEVNIQIEYSDTGSTNNIYNILTTLAKCRNSNYNIEMVFNWIYEEDDEEILELGKFIESRLNVMFNYVKI
jgi:hypothetical protein